MTIAIRPALPIHELARNQCRWPVNNPPAGDEHLFCGARKDGSKPYCTAHCRLAYRPKATA